MKKLLLAIILCAGFAASVLGQSVPPTKWQELDGSPSVTSPTVIKFPNGTLTISGKTVTYTPSGGGGGGITIGTTTITSGTNTRILYNNAGVVGEYTVTGTGTTAVLSASPTLTGIVPVTSSVTTGTGTSSGFSVAADSLTTGAGANFASSSVTSGSVVNIASTSTAAASSTLKGLNIAISGANGTTAQTVTGATISVTNTNATSGTNVGLSIAASGATTSNKAIDVTAGTSNFAGQVISGLNSGTTVAAYGFSVESGTGMGRNDTIGGLTFLISGSPKVGINSGTVVLKSDVTFGFSASTAVGTSDTTLRRSAAANLAFGAADAAAPVAQTLSVQNVVAGTSNTAGVNWTHIASRGTGTGVGGDYIVQVAPAGGSGTAQNTLVNAFTVKGNGAVQLLSVTFANLPTVANGYLIYCSDCTAGSSPCTSGGSGSLAVGQNSAWKCF